MLRGYIACSADGYVADAEGGVGFLEPFDTADLGYEGFLGEIDTVVMGRATYDQILGFAIPWPYADKECFVVTSSDLAAAPDGVQRWQGGLADFAAAAADRSVWVLGGAQLQAGFIAAGLLERLELFVIPVLLGQGVKLFAHAGPPVPLTLTGCDRFASGIVRLDYRLEGAA